MMAVPRVVPCCLHSVPGCIKADTAILLKCSNESKNIFGGGCVWSFWPRRNGEGEVHRILHFFKDKPNFLLGRPVLIGPFHDGCPCVGLSRADLPLNAKLGSSLARELKGLYREDRDVQNPLQEAALEGCLLFKRWTLQPGDSGKTDEGLSKFCHKNKQRRKTFLSYKIETYGQLPDKSKIRGLGKQCFEKASET